MVLKVQGLILKCKDQEPFEFQRELIQVKIICQEPVLEVCLQMWKQEEKMQENAAKAWRLKMLL